MDLRLGPVGPPCRRRKVPSLPPRGLRPSPRGPYNTGVAAFRPADEEPRSRARAGLRRDGVRVLHEDNHVLVVVKPPGLPAQGGRGLDRHLVERLETYRRASESKPGRAFVGLVHRLDRNVGGVMVVAKTSKAARRLAEAFRRRSPDLEKTYLAWVAGRVEGEEGTLLDRLRREGGVTRRARGEDVGGRPARLAWRVDGRGATATRLEVRLETGFAHQIRAQLAMAGHPVLGDGKYGGPPAPALALFARRLAVPHPVGDEVLVGVAPLPPALSRLDHALALEPAVA